MRSVAHGADFAFFHVRTKPLERRSLSEATDSPKKFIGRGRRPG
jgi:hypothetical protein